MKPLLLIGNPEHARVANFQAALAERGHPPARVVAWIELVKDARALAQVPNEPLLVRMDTYGQNFEVERALLRRGYARAAEMDVTTLTPSEIDALTDDRGRILAPRQHHLGFESVLGDVERVFAEKDRWTILQPLRGVRDLFDKRASHANHARAGVPVPRAFDVRAVGDLPVDTTVYVKLTSGSSASCLGIWDGRGLFTTMEIAGDRLYNSRRVRRYAKDASLRLLRFLLREGSHVEARVPKAAIDGQPFDLRVVVIAGEPAFVVVRQSTHEITNIHLGGKRGSVPRVREKIPPEVWDAAMDSAARSARAHRCFQVGVDLLFERDLRGHCVVEANAFGDFFPGYAEDGETIYAREVRALEAL